MQRRAALGILLGLLAAPAAAAHQTNTCYLTAEVGAESIRLRALWSFHTAFSEMETALENTAEYTRTRIHILADQKPLTLEPGRTGIERDVSGQEYLAVELNGSFPADSETVGISLDASLFESFGQTFSVLVKVEHDQRSQQGVLTIGEPSKTFRIRIGGQT